MSLTTNQIEKGGTVVLELSGRLVYGPEAKALWDQVKRLLENNKSKIILNMENVTYCDSCGLGYLAGMFTSVRNQKGELRFVRPSERVRELLTVTKLNTIFQIYESIDDALASIK